VKAQQGDQSREGQLLHYRVSFTYFLDYAGLEFAVILTEPRKSVIIISFHLVYILDL